MVIYLIGIFLLDILRSLDYDALSKYKDRNVIKNSLFLSKITSSLFIIINNIINICLFKSTQ